MLLDPLRGQAGGVTTSSIRPRSTADQASWTARHASERDNDALCLRHWCSRAYGSARRSRCAGKTSTSHAARSRFGQPRQTPACGPSTSCRYSATNSWPTAHELWMLRPCSYSARTRATGNRRAHPTPATRQGHRTGKRQAQEGRLRVDSESHTSRPAPHIRQLVIRDRRTRAVRNGDARSHHSQPDARGLRPPNEPKRRRARATQSSRRGSSLGRGKGRNPGSDRR